CGGARAAGPRPGAPGAGGEAAPRGPPGPPGPSGATREPEGTATAGEGLSLAARHARRPAPGVLRDALLHGRRPPGLQVVDAHAHLGGGPNFTIPRSGYDDVVRTMDETGIDVAWIAPLLGCAADYRAGNRLMAEALRRHPGRFRGLVVVNPNYPTGMGDELARYGELEGVAGIKLHPGFRGYPISGPAYRPVWAYAHERRLP